VFNQYFGNYLLNKGLLSTEQLCDVLAYERSVRTKLGILAIDAGFMTAAQVEEVHQLQHTMDKKFGEIAIDKGYLASSRLEDLLDSQNTKRLSLSQAILDRGYLNLAQLETELEAYKRDSNLTSNQLEALHSSIFEVIVRTFIDLSTAKGNPEPLYDYTALMLRNILRFLGDEPVIDTDAPPVRGWLISQEMTGGINLFTGLVLDDALLLELATRFSGEQLDTVDELAKDSLAEFLNETNGIFTVNMSDRGIELDLKPQQVQQAQLPLKGFRIPLKLSGGQFDLYIDFK
jgi:hypothetical protein